MVDMESTTFEGAPMARPGELNRKRAAGAFFAGLACILLAGPSGCDMGSNQVVLETEPNEKSVREQRAAEDEAERQARAAAVAAELAMLERERLRHLKKVEEYKEQQRLLAEREADLGALKKEAAKLSISTTMERRGMETPVTPNVPLKPVVDAHHLLFAERCDKTLGIIDELNVSVAATIMAMRKKSVSGTKDHKPSYYRLQIEKFYGFQDIPCFC